MKRFAKSFGVTGSPAQLEAFKEWAESIGWVCESWLDEYEDMYFSNNNERSLKAGRFWKCIVGKEENGERNYSLPSQWAEAMQAASEVVEEPKPEFKRGDKVRGAYTNKVVLVTDVHKDDTFSCVVIDCGINGAPIIGTPILRCDCEAYVLHTEPVTL